MHRTVKLFIVVSISYSHMTRTLRSSRLCRSIGGDCFRWRGGGGESAHNERKSYENEEGDDSSSSQRKREQMGNNARNKKHKNKSKRQDGERDEGVWADMMSLGTRRKDETHRGQTKSWGSECSCIFQLAQSSERKLHETHTKWTHLNSKGSVHDEQFGAMMILIEDENQVERERKATLKH